MKFLTLLFLAITTMVNAETKLMTDLPLKYLVSEPAAVNSTVTNRALIIFLHGYGSNEADLFELKQEFSTDYIYLSVQAPMTLAPGSYQWYGLSPSEQPQVAGNILKHTKMLEDFIAAAIKKYQTEADKVILVGFSQGAMMSYELALQHPKSVRGIAVLSGKILPPLKEKIKPGLDLSGLRIFIGHGTGDDRVYFREANEAQVLLEKTSIKPAFHAYQKLGHSINQEELTDLKKWIEETLVSKR